MTSFNIRPYEEKDLLEVMNSKDLSDEAKLYIVQNLKDDTITQEPIKQEPTDGKVVTYGDCWPDLTPRPFNPDASFGDFPTMGSAMEAIKKACAVPDSFLADTDK